MVTNTNRKFFIFLFGLFFVLTPSTVQAQMTSSDLLIQIENLLQTVLELQNKLTNLNNESTTNNSSAGEFCRGIELTLWRGLRHKGVMELQTYLRSTGDYTHSEITGYYGFVTEAAVKTWQSRNGVVSNGTPESTGFGVFGPASQAKVKSLCQKKGVLTTEVTSQPKCVQYSNPICSVNTISLSAGVDYQGCPLPRRCVSASFGSGYFQGIESGGIAHTVETPQTNQASKSVCRDFESFHSRTGLCLVNNGLIENSSRTNSDSYVETFDHKGANEDDESPFVVYSVSDGNFTLIQEAYNLTQKEEVLAKNEPQHKAIWDLIQTIFASVPVFDSVSEFSIFSDGNGNTYAYVAKTVENVRSWVLAVDPADIVHDDGHQFLDLEDFLETLLHEFTHVFTLDDTQTNVHAVKSECTSTYFAGEDFGCSNRSSYMNIFYQRFWAGALYDEYQSTISTCQGGNCSDSEYAFYTKHESKFISPFAFLGPEEDIAESFTYFVLSERPVGNSTWEQKLLFFYEFPEMIRLRQELQSGLFKVHESASN